MADPPSGGGGVVGWLRRVWEGFARSPAVRAGRFDDLDDEEGDTAEHGAGAAPLPLEDAIDLHHFAPRDVPSVVDEYLRAAREAGFAEVTIIHGRGKGVQRQVVQRILAAHPAVEGFGPASGARATGATVARLRPGGRPQGRRSRATGPGPGRT